MGSPRPSGLAARAWAFVKHHALTVYALLVVAYLMLPIAVVILSPSTLRKSTSTTCGRDLPSTTGSTGTPDRDAGLGS